MKRAFLAIICGAALMASTVASVADVVSDKEMAERYSQAAQSGDTDAQFYLGALYSAGVGRPRSDEEAFQWFSRAADHGHSHAMLVLAGVYAVGRNRCFGLAWCRAPAIGLGLGLVDFFTRQPGIQDADELAASVAEFVNPAAN